MKESLKRILLVMWKQQTVKAGDDKQIRSREGPLICDQRPEKVLKSV